MMMFKLFKSSTLTVAILSAFFSSQIFAKNNVELPTLEPIVITVSKTEQALSNVPAHINVIDKKMIEQNPTLNLSDILKNDASIYIKQNGGVGQGVTLSLRATHPKHTLLLNNGVRLNTQNTLTPIYPETLDLTNTHQIEVLKGSASVQHGSDAIGGVVQMLSKTPEKTETSITGVYGENNTYKVIVKGDIVADNGVYAQLSGQRMETDGTRLFNTQTKEQKYGYDQKGYNAKIGYNIDTTKAELSFSKNKGNNEYASSGAKAIRQFDNHTLLTKFSTKLKNNITLSAYYGKAKDEQTYIENAKNQYNSKHDEFDVNKKLDLSLNQNILLGATYSKDKYQDAYASVGEKSIKSTGYYVQHQYNSDRMNTQLGIRLEDNQKYGTHVVQQGAVRYHLNPNTSIYTNIGSAFKAPSLNELYYNSVCDAICGGE